MRAKVVYVARLANISLLNHSMHVLIFVFIFLSLQSKSSHSGNKVVKCFGALVICVTCLGRIYFLRNRI